MTEAVRDHLLAATHFVLGPTNFLVLRLPGNWDVRIGRNPTEIDYTIAYNGVRWAQQGQATAFLIDESAKRAMEFDVRAARGALRPPLLEGARESSFKVGGHPGSLLHGGMRAGLFRNKHLRVVYVAYRCEETQRNLTMKFMASGDASGLDELPPALAGSRCH